MQQAAILEAEANLPDRRRGAGQRHSLPLCLALFTLAVVAGNKGFIAIGDWIQAYRTQLIDSHLAPGNLNVYSVTKCNRTPEFKVE